MAPYMMSVGLWVGCIAFSLMYPLTQYSGKLRSGAAWWLSKASVLYPTALLQALAMIGALHVFNGFDPERMGDDRGDGVCCLSGVHVGHVFLYQSPGTCRQLPDAHFYGDPARRVRGGDIPAGNLRGLCPVSPRLGAVYLYGDSLSKYDQRWGEY